MAIIGDGEQIQVNVYMLDDDTFDAVRARLASVLGEITSTLPCRAELHDGFDIEDFG
jgi:hypothetical protein